MWALISLKTAASIVLLFLRELKQVEGDNKENLQRSSDDIQFILRSRSIARALGFQTITSPLTETDDSKRRSWKKSKESKKSKGKSAKKKSAKCGHRGSKSGKRSKSNSDEATGKEVPRKRKKGKGNCNGDTPPPAIHPTPAPSSSPTNSPTSSRPSKTSKPTLVIPEVGPSAEPSMKPSTTSKNQHPSERPSSNPTMEFHLKNCESYTNKWLFDLSLSCDSTLSTCQCFSADRLIENGKIDCTRDICPEHCTICEYCLTDVISCLVSNAGALAEELQTLPVAASSVLSNDSFDLQDCENYENRWLHDLDSTCAIILPVENGSETRNCDCADAQRRIDKGEIKCGKAKCPDDCEVCKFCLHGVLGC